MVVKERNGVLICARSANEERSKYWNAEIPPENPNELVRATINKAYYFIEHIDEENCRFHGMVNVNPNFAYIPDWFFNFVIKRALYIVIGKVQDKKNFENEILDERI